MTKTKKYYAATTSFIFFRFIYYFNLYSISWAIFIELQYEIAENLDVSMISNYSES